MPDQHALDLYLTVSFLADKAVAYIEAAGKESFTCTTAQLEQFLQNHHVRFGIQWEVLDRIVSTSTGPSQKVPVAIGLYPRHGMDGKVELLVDAGESTEQRPLEREDGKVDHKELLRLSNVRKGQMIARLLPPGEGQPGKDVTGADIPGKPGRPARLKPGKNVVLSPDESAMYAAIDGLVSRTDRDKLNVFPLYEVKGDVDYGVGNIDFVGTVVIKGNVLSGFSVRAAGDIRVVGGVEGADLTAGGSIEITGGIIGYHKGSVNAGTDVKVAFIQDGNVSSGQDVVVSQSIMHSNVRAGRDVLCGGTKGLIVGGIVQAGVKVSARTIGNSMSTATSVEVGVLPELRNEIDALRKRLRELLDQSGKTAKALALLEQMAAAGTLPPDKQAMQIKLAATRRLHMREETDIKRRVKEIEKMLEDDGEACVEVIKTIYGGSKVVIGRYTRFVKDPMERVVFRYTNGDVAALPII